MPSDPETTAAAEPTVSEDPQAAERSGTQEASAMVVATRLQLKNWLKLWQFSQGQRERPTPTEGRSWSDQLLPQGRLSAVAFFHVVSLGR